MDNILRHSDKTAPYQYNWDTLPEPSGEKTIKAAATDTNGQQGYDTVNVMVRNIRIALIGERNTDSAWIVQRQYGKLDITTENGTADTISRYIIYRRENDEGYLAVGETSGAGTQTEAFTYNDKYIEKNKTYTYIVQALDSSDNILSSSNEITL